MKICSFIVQSFLLTLVRMTLGKEKKSLPWRITCSWKLKKKTLDSTYFTLSSHCGQFFIFIFENYLLVRIYIYKTVVSDRVLTLNRLYAYPSAVLRHASGPTGPRNSSRSFSPFIKSSLPGIVEITVLQKANLTQPLKNQQLYFEMKLFLAKGFF